MKSVLFTNNTFKHTFNARREAEGKATIMNMLLYVVSHQSSDMTALLCFYSLGFVCRRWLERMNASVDNHWVFFSFFI